MQMQELEKVLTFKQAMSYLQVSRSTLLRLMDAGKLIGHKVGNNWRFYISDVQNCIERKLAS